MPEFGNYLELVEKLRLGVKLHSPEDMARMLKSAQYTQFERDDMLRLRALIEELIVEEYGQKGVDRFRKIYDNRKRFGLF